MHMRTEHPLIAALIVFLACSAWGGVAWFLRYVDEQSASRQAAAVDAAAESVHDAARLKLHAFARDTESVRATLDTAARVDVTGIARSIAAAGHDAGVAVAIGDASASTARQASGALTPVTIIVSADGAFGRLLLLESLIETIPMPVAVDSFSLTRDTEGASTASWHLSLRVRALAFLPTPAI